MPEELFTSDPANYRKLSEPFADADEANEALQAFAKEVRELRAKYGLADVHVIVEASFLGADGQEGEAMISFHHGSELKAESMCAYAFGAETARRQERIASLLGKSIKTPKSGK